MSIEYIPLEKPIAEVEEKIDELRRIAAAQAVNLDREIQALEKKAERIRKDIFRHLTAYQRAQVARHPRRPTSLDLIGRMCHDFIELHGDRNFQDDAAIVGGLGQIDSYRVVLIGHQKGRSTKDNIKRNFGMPRPEGYRKALRLMSMAERFSLPIVTLVDTPGAYPGVGAEERGQSEAIAKNIMVMCKLKVPIISIVIGEGGSGGALAIAVANRVHMLENAIYSVISPEGCASILFKDASLADKAAESLKLTAKDAKSFKVIDSIIPEPLGGAHRNPEEVASLIKQTILHDLNDLTSWDPQKLREHRMHKFESMGKFEKQS